MKKETKFSVDSGYLLPALELMGSQPGLAMIHQVIVSTATDSGGDGTLTLDPNQCQLDEFGAIGACTEIATLSFPAKIQLVSESRGRRLFSIDARGYSGPPLRVVLRPRGAGGQEFVAQLLVLDDGGSIKRIVNLKSAPRS